MSTSAAFRRCSLLSMSMFDTPMLAGNDLLDDHLHMDPFTPMAMRDGSMPHPGNPRQKLQLQHQNRQQQHQQYQPMNGFSHHQQYHNSGISNLSMPNIPNISSIGSSNLIMSDKSESSLTSVPSLAPSSYSTRGNLGNYHSPVTHLSTLALPTTFDGPSTSAAKVSPVSYTKASVQIPTKIMSSPNPVTSHTPVLSSPAGVSPAGVSPDGVSKPCLRDDDEDEDEEGLDQHRFKPFHEEKWTLRYKELLEFHQEHGHAAVPHTYPRNPQLARWVKRQRRQYKLRTDDRPSTMTTERLDMLSSVGFVWDSHDVNWREKLEALQKFRKDHGHCNVPSNYVDKKLATWVKCQRRQYKLYWDGKPSAMSPERILELEKVGFEWEIRSTLPRKVAPKDQTQEQGAHQLPVQPQGDMTLPYENMSSAL
jgi:hypothetical protein